MDTIGLKPLIERLYPICRSITGNGVRETLGILSELLPLEIIEVPSGTKAFDWTVPDEWNIRDAWIENEDGERVVDFQNSNLHVLNYSIPVDRRVGLRELNEHLYSLPEQPDLIPYRTSYYAEKWGFCLSHRVRESLSDQTYHVKIDADRSPGSLTYAECVIDGQIDEEVVLYTHICHPSLCNDNLSGIAILAALGRRMLEWPRPRYRYRLVFAPGTIGSIVWLSENRTTLDRISHGLVLGLLGDDAHHSYKRTRSGTSEIDKIVEYVLAQTEEEYEVVPFSPYGYDERQFGSPGINLSVGRLTRSTNGGYPEYHTSADNPDLVTEVRLRESLDVVTDVIKILDANRYFVNLEPYCEPQLGRRGLYSDTGGSPIASRESAMLWLLNQSDGCNSLLDIAQASGVDIRDLAAVAEELVSAQLLEEKVTPKGGI